MFAVPAVKAWIERIFFYDLKMPANLFGDRGWILVHFLRDLFEGHTVPQTRFNDNPFAER